MEKPMLSVFVVLLAASVLFAADTAWYANSNSLQVSRTLEVNKTARISESTGTVVYSYSSMVTLVLKNAGTIERKGVVASDKLASLPDGAKISYSPIPYMAIKDGAAKWDLGSLKPGESAKIVAVIDAELSKEWLVSVGAPDIALEDIKATLTAAKSVNMGETVDVTLVTVDGIPVPKAKLVAISPSGKKIEMLTDAEGLASYRASESGTYLYSAEGYTLAEVPETVAKPLVVSPPITAAVQPEPAQANALSQFTLVIAGFMLVSLVLLGIIAYYSMKGEEGAAPAQPQKKEAAAPAAPAQAVMAAPAQPKEEKKEPKAEAARIEKAKEMTKRILEARKKELEAKKAAKKK